MINVENLVSRRPGSVHVSTDNLRTGVLFKNAGILKNANSWHAFILHNVENPKRNETLEIVLQHLYPLDLVPVRFEAHGKDCVFLARNCALAVEKLCNDNLLIPNQRDPLNPIKCEIILQYSTQSQMKVDMQKNILSVMFKLFDSSTKTLNLENFSAHSDLTEYCPLSQPKIMYFVLHLATGIHPLHINLRKNEIHSLTPLEALTSSSSLISLDLRDNLIDSDSSLSVLKMLGITEISFHNNPICNHFDEYTYVEKIKEMIPKIQKVDGISIMSNGLPETKKNSLCDPDGFCLVDQFLEYYFTAYDNNRKVLEGLYHPNAQFSMTNIYKQGQTTSNSARLRPYQMYNRNLMAIADISKSEQFLMRGNNAIIKILMDLPRSEHDPFSFSVDLMHHNDKTAVLNISGIFREAPDALLDAERYLGFNRTFVLAGSNGEYSITNDMLHVYNALTCQVSRAFAVTRLQTEEKLPLPVTTTEKKAARLAVESATGVTKNWSKKLLEEAEYDVIKCLKTFIELYKIDKIPKEAFRS